MNNEFTLRPLNTKDIFSLVKIISKFGVKEIRICIKAHSFVGMTGKENYRASGIVVTQSPLMP